MAEPIEFEFTRPEDRPDLSPITNAAIGFAALCGQLATEERTWVYTPNGHPENVAEHSRMVALVAAELAAQYFPELDADRVARLGNVHDILEAYVKDTPTHRISQAELAAKAIREHAGFLQLRREYAAYPAFVTLVTEYEAQEIPESRFVRMVDKLMPLLAHINNGGRGLREHTDMTADEILTDAAKRARQFLEEYPEQAQIIGVRGELAALVANGLKQG